jgi:hypothetical protein
MEGGRSIIPATPESFLIARLFIWLHMHVYCSMYTICTVYCGQVRSIDRLLLCAQQPWLSRRLQFEVFTDWWSRHQVKMIDRRIAVMY